MADTIRKAHAPTRMCVICRSKHAKGELLRYVCPSAGNNDTALVFDEKQVLPGRGYYICSNPECAQRLARFKVRRK
ncbi:YlxR family protein [Desulfovibrio subterraneus]|uniref:YlxR family protein n=2 Tax=Desulfovibrio subterraneus TaxID=2718620 RepID=UPI00157B79B8|nr:DUF448 domain-containing protein [Desulfovibrio subterraneus]